jgi:hypothetical protein
MLLPLLRLLLILLPPPPPPLLLAGHSLAHDLKHLLG